jgi:hypothetical protein
MAYFSCEEKREEFVRGFRHPEYNKEMNVLEGLMTKMQ